MDIVMSTFRLEQIQLSESVVRFNVIDDVELNGERMANFRVGFLIVNLARPGKLDTDIHPSCRRKGYARALYLHAAKQLGQLSSCGYQRNEQSDALWDNLRAHCDVTVSGTGYPTFTLKVA
jgi:GNAT superfamily N-acetyltransferase